MAKIEDESDEDFDFIDEESQEDSNDDETKPIEEFKDLYDDLEITLKATADEIKKSYFKLARKYHPDQNPDDPTCTEKFQKIGRAYEVIFIFFNTDFI